jgi:hypothetical protein
MTLWQMTKRYGFHFVSLLAVVVFMVSAIRRRCRCSATVSPSR